MREVAAGYGLVEAPLWDPAKGLYYYTAPSDPNDEGYDHSVSQIAALGLWAMSRRGAEIRHTVP